MVFYNDIVLINSVGTAALRASNPMKNRKVSRTHQNVMVFYKGDSDNIFLQNFEHFRENINMHQDVMVFYKGDIEDIQKHFSPNQLKNESKDI